MRTIFLSLVFSLTTVASDVPKEGVRVTVIFKKETPCFQAEKLLRDLPILLDCQGLSA